LKVLKLSRKRESGRKRRKGEKNRGTNVGRKK
jgi:hypothetical protein